VWLCVSLGARLAWQEKYGQSSMSRVGMGVVGGAGMETRDARLRREQKPPALAGPAGSH
jgi:hypothetical protein